MAIDGNVYSGKEVILGFAEETTFGTAIGDAGTFVQLPEFGSVSIDWGVTQTMDTTNRGYRYAYSGDNFTTTAGGVRVITINDYVPRRNDLAFFLYGLTQNVTEGAAAPYQKEFSFHSTQPDFTSDAGLFLTVGIQLPGSNYDLKFTSCVVSELKFKADLTGGDGRLKCDVTLISGFTPNTTANFSGTWGVQAQEYIHIDNPSAKTINSNDIVFYNMEFTLTNGAERYGDDSSGQCESYMLKNFEFLGSLDVKWDNNTRGALADFIAGTARDIMIATGTDGNEGYFAVNAQNCTYIGASDDAGDTLIRKLEFRADYDGSNQPSVILADGVDRTW